MLPTHEDEPPGRDEYIARVCELLVQLHLGCSQGMVNHLVFEQLRDTIDLRHEPPHTYGRREHA